MKLRDATALMHGCGARARARPHRPRARLPPLHARRSRGSQRLTAPPPGRTPSLRARRSAKSSSFFKAAKGSKSDQDWACFSIVFKGRTVDFAATSAAQLLDWYLALAYLLPHSTEALLEEPTLRTNMGNMGLGRDAPGAASSPRLSKTPTKAEVAWA